MSSQCHKELLDELKQLMPGRGKSDWFLRLCDGLAKIQHTIEVIVVIAGHSSEVIAMYGTVVA